MNVKSLITAAVTTAVLAAAAAAQAGVIVQDGAFNAPSGGGSYTAYAGGSSMGAWTVTGDSVDLIGGYWQAPTVGGGSVDLNGTGQGGITQNLGVLSAGVYDLTFYVSGNPDGAPSTKSLDVSVGGVGKTFAPASGATHADMGYQLETVSFRSDGVNSTVLSFASGDTGDYGPVIGGVSIAAVPEPATWAMLILGVGMIGFAARRRQGVALAA